MLNLAEGTTYLSHDEAAKFLGIAPGTLYNRRCLEGDKFLRANTKLVSGQLFYDLEDVRKLADERAARKRGA